MQIPNLSINPVQQRQSPRQNNGDRELRNGSDDNTPPSINQSATELETDKEQLIQRAIESSQQSREVFSRKLADSEDLSLNSRRALQAFSDNTPSAEQQLGIELVGVDTYA